MKVGTIVSTAWRHYLANFFCYLPMALRGTVWRLIPVSLLLMTLLYMLKEDLTPGSFSGLTALLIPAWLVLFFWCTAQSLGEVAGISRSVYQVLSASQGTLPETPATALRFTRSRKFSLLGSGAVKGTILGLLNFIFSCVLALAVVMVFFGLGVLPGSTPSLGLFFGGGGIGVVSVIVFVWLYAWIALRLLMNEQLLAIENESGAVISIGQSWRLMRTHLMRSLWVILLAFFITLPVMLTMAVFAQIGHPFLFQQMGIVIAAQNTVSMGLIPYLTFYLVISILGLIGDIIVQPFFRTVLTTLYFDIKNRK